MRASFLHFGRPILLRILQTTEFSAVPMPAGTELLSYQCAISSGYPIFDGVFGVCDGPKLDLEQASQNIMKNMIYNG